MRLGIIGCGSLGTAILQGIHGHRSDEDPDAIVIESCAVSVRSEESATILRDKFSNFKTSLSVYGGDNLQTAEQSNTILLAVPPDDLASVLAASGMRDALKGKLVISLAAGVTRAQIDSALYGGSVPQTDDKDRCHIMRAMPNLAAAVGQSMTALDVTNQPPAQEKIKLAEGLFKKVGTVLHVPETSFNACTFLCGSTPAAVALFCDAMIDGAVAAGVPRKTAQPIVIQILSSAAALMQNGQSPSDLREHVCAQPGCTIGAMMTLEKGGVRGVIAGATQDGVLLASGLGQGKS